VWLCSSASTAAFVNRLTTMMPSATSRARRAHTTPVVWIVGRDLFAKPINNGAHAGDMGEQPDQPTARQQFADAFGARLLLPQDAQ